MDIDMCKTAFTYSLLNREQNVFYKNLSIDNLK